MLSSVLNSLAERYQPDPFRQSVPRRRAVTLTDLEEACRWQDLTAVYSLPDQCTALGLGQLRFSRVFPEMFLQYDETGSVSVLTVREAAAVVIERAREFPPR